MDRKIVMATAADSMQIMDLYRQQLGKEYCAWTEHYPTEREIEFDLSRDSLFVMKEKDKVIAAISIDDDPDVKSLTCWSEELQPGGEVSRVAVDIGCQNQGIAREMVKYAESEMKKRGFKSIHLLVNKNNIKALKSYEKLNFKTVGECELFDQPFWCYERKL